MMTVHVLHAGDGYSYLTKQVAVGDQDLKRGQELTDYYTATGEPPGIWAGSGTRSLGVSGRVREDQMQALFGEGLHPDADILGPIQLGRPFPKFANDTAFKTAYVAAVSGFRATHGRGATEDERANLRTQVARELLPRGVQGPAAVQAFLAQERRSERQAVAGVDLVFSPAKSISTLWAVGSGEQMAAVEAAHEQAWREVLTFLEKEAAFTRIGKAGVAQVETHGLVVTAFNHRTSRTGDPDLHTHMVVANKVQGLDGKWRALDARVLHSLGVTASEMYNARIEDALVRRLGVSFHDVEREDGKRPVREIQGISPELNKAFSRRRGDIEARYTELLREYRSAHHRDPSRAIQVQLSQQATLETREGKGPHQSLAQHREAWRATAAQVLGGEQGVARMLSDVRGAGRSNHDRRTLAQVSEDVLTVVSGERSSWNRWHVRAEAERQLRAYPTADRAAAVDQVEAHVLSPGRSIRLTMDGTETLPTELQRSDGQSVFRVHGQARYTSQAVLDAEQRLVRAGRTMSPWRAQVPGDVLVGLGVDQRKLVQHFAGAGTVLAVGVGAAGTGKTTAMAALVKSWRGRVIGLAPSAVAAEQLGSGIGAQASTIARLLTLRKHGHLTAEIVKTGDMLLVDEAGLASTADLDALRELAIERGAVLRLLGDHRQGSAVGAGGAFSLLVDDLGAVEMTEVHRFKDAAEREPSLGLRSGDQEAAAFYMKNERVHAGTVTDVSDQVYAAWKLDREAGRAALMLANSNATVAELNTRARLDLIAEGVVTGDGVDLRNEQRASLGDTIVTRHNDSKILVGHRGQHVRNGELWTVLAQGADGSLTVQQVGKAARTTLPADYVSRHVDLGYAITVSRAQGSTVDRAHVIVEPGMTRQQLYVAMSRGSESNDAYVPIESHIGIDVDRAPDARTDAETVFRQVIARDGSELSATQAMREELEAPEKLDRLVPEYQHAVDLLTPDIDHRAVLQTVFSRERADAILADDAAGALCTEMGKHRDPAGAVAQAVQRRGELDTAESVAKVLQWRLQQLRPAEQDGPLPWVGAVPDGPASELRDWAVGRAEKIRQRADELAARVAAERPEWSRTLGDRPVEAQAQAWDRAVALAASYREQHQVTDQSSVLGPVEPTSRAYAAAAEAVRLAAPVRPYAAYTDRQLATRAAQLRADQTRAQAAQEYIREHGEAIAAGRGPAMVKAQEQVAQLRQRAAEQAQEALALRERVEESLRAVTAKEQELAAATGMFAGKRRQALTAELQQLRTVHSEREAVAAAHRPPEQDTEAVAAQVLAKAAQDDPAVLRARQAIVDRFDAQRDELSEITQEQRARADDPSLAVPDDLTQERGRQRLEQVRRLPEAPTVDHSRGMGR